MTGAQHELLIDADHPALAGHFPGRPIVPGVLLLAGVLDAIDAQRAARGEAPGEGCLMRTVKFHSPALPGQRLQVALESSADGVVAFCVSEGGRRVASGTLEIGPAQAPPR